VTGIRSSFGCFANRGKLRIHEKQVAGDAMDISTWLRDLDLAQYEPIFRENAIDAEILPELTEADLEKLGVVLGHRKRMLARSPRSTPALQGRLRPPLRAPREPSGAS
jgi:SAM domain (Sterile alpha motif)